MNEIQAQRYRTAADFGINSCSHTFGTDALGVLQRPHRLGLSRFELGASYSS